MAAPPGNQIQRLCDASRDAIKADLQDIGDIFQKGIPAWMDDNMPPIMSQDPTCDDGILPYEPPVLKEASTNSAKSNFYKIESAFYRDMMGEGSKRPSDWGWLNMVLSDTIGNPYSYHTDMTTISSIFRFTRYVDHYIPYQPDPTLFPPKSSAWAHQELQFGAYPKTIAKQLQGEILQLKDNSNFRATKDIEDTSVFFQSYEQLGFIKTGRTKGGWFGIGAEDYTDVDVELTTLPDYGYNVKPVVEWNNKRVRLTRYAREKTPDLSLSYRDGGFFGTPTTVNNHNFFSYGFDIDLFINDITKQNDNFFWRSGDTSRVVVYKTINTQGMSLGDSFFATEENDDEGGGEGPARPMSWQEYEFISKDRILEDNPLVDSGYYINFDRALRDPVAIVPPQLTLLSDMISKSGGLVATGRLENVYNDTMNMIWKLIVADVADNDNAYRYGAPADNLSKRDVDYGYDEGGEFIGVFDYIKKRIQENPDWRMRDLPLGISRMQWLEENEDGPENRVFYLDPKDYGGKNWNPPFYIKPAPPTGFFGASSGFIS